MTFREVYLDSSCAGGALRKSGGSPISRSQHVSTLELKVQAASNFMQLRTPKEITLWLFNIAMENGPFIDDFPIKTSIYQGFSMAILNNQMVDQID
jgi:hypothetical protein